VDCTFNILRESGCYLRGGYIFVKPNRQLKKVHKNHVKSPTLKKLEDSVS